MKLWKHAALSIAIAPILAISAAAQAAEAKPTPQPTPAPITNPKYDADLAKKLGGNDMGMRRYIAALLKTGPNDAKITEKAKRDELFAGHMGTINRLAAEGKLVMAGPFSDDKKIYRGLYIFNVETIEEAQKLTETDPSIAAGVFQVEFVKWYGSAGLMMMNEIYEKITKAKP
jgi:uncharacterized protein YciI